MRTRANQFLVREYLSLRTGIAKRGGAIAAFIDNEQVGVIRWQLRPDGLYIEGVTVSYDWQGNGVATRLVETFLAGPGAGKRVYAASTRENTDEGNRLIQGVNRRAGRTMIGAVDQGYDG